MRCVLCAKRNKVTEGDSHVCVACGGWLMHQVGEIARLAMDAAAWVAPGSSAGGGSRPVPGSRPPLRVDALDPELTVVDGQTLTVLECLELWERMIREMRQMAPYGPASAARAAQVAPNGDLSHAGGLYLSGAVNDTRVTLVGCVAFLGAQVAWMSTEPDFPVEDFADEVTACVRVLRRWDVTAEDRGQVVLCPTLHEDEGECRARLHYRDWDEQVTCPRCRVTRDASTLVAVAMSDGREVWLDPEAAAKWLGIGESTLRLWAKRGQVERKNGRYRVRHGMTA